MVFTLLRFSVSKPCFQLVTNPRVPYTLRARLAPYPKTERRITMSKSPHESTSVSEGGQSSTAVKSQKTESLNQTETDLVVPPLTINVSTVEDLYAAVNDPSNVGASVILEKGRYVLSADDPKGARRPNEGRLELQADMSLIGVATDRSAVIDTTLLPASSFVGPGGRTGTIRLGYGSNAVEALTIIGNPLSAAGIAVDLFGQAKLATGSIRISNVLSGDSSGQYNSRGIDLRSVTTDMNGRVFDALITNCEVFGCRQGIRIVHMDGASNGQIKAVMNNVRSFNNRTGCLIANNRTEGSKIEVTADDCVLENNGAGCVILGSLISAGTGTGNGNDISLNAHRTRIRNNDGPVEMDGGGIVATAADTPAKPGKASNNKVVINLFDCEVFGNQDTDFAVWGARNQRWITTSEVSGTANSVAIELHGTTVKVEATASIPYLATANNEVTVKSA
jgi:hypothetical protein